MAHNPHSPEPSPTGQAIEDMFSDYRQTDQAIDRFLQLVESDATSAEDVRMIIHDLYGGIRQPVAFLFAGEESQKFIKPVSGWPELEVAKRQIDDRYSGQIHNESQTNDVEMEERMKADCLAIIRHFIAERRQAIQDAVAFCHAPIAVQSIEVISWRPFNLHFENKADGEKISLHFTNHSITITAERIIDGSSWVTHNQLNASQCPKDSAISLLDVSPSKSAFAREELSKIHPRFIERNINDCPWRRTTDDDGYAIHYSKDLMVSCLVLEGALPPMSRREVQQCGYQNPVFADTAKQQSN